MPDPVEARILEAIPPLAGRPAGFWQFEPMGGITNRTYKVAHGPMSQEREAYVLRIAAESTGYLDRAAEAHNARLAGQAGIAPAVLYADAKVMVTAYLAGARPLTYADLAAPDHLAQIATVLRRLQQVREPFQGARHPFGEIDKYLKLHPDPRSLDLRRRAEPVAAALAGTSLPAVPAHVDPNPANFLLCADGSLLMVDWEFSAMTDPCWDIGSILSMLPYDAARVHRFSEAIAGKADQMFLARVALFRAAMFLVAGSWCAMEAAFRNDGALRQMADGYLDRCAEALAHPELPRWLSGHFPAA